MKTPRITERKRYLVQVSFTSGKYTLKEIAAKYGISTASVSNILTKQRKMRTKVQG